jgi:hypothetical protein
MRTILRLVVPRTMRVVDHHHAAALEHERTGKSFSFTPK